MIKRISIKELPDGATMAHVAAASGAFPSITQARKNGHDGPITLGVHKITKKIIVEVVDEEIVKKIEQPELDATFWPNFEEANNPSPMAQAIQMPLTNKNWQNTVINAWRLHEKHTRKLGKVQEGIQN